MFIFAGSNAIGTPPRKTSTDRFLNSENDKNDYDWYIFILLLVIMLIWFLFSEYYYVFRLLTPPGTPLFPTLETHKTVTARGGTPKARPTALKSRVTILCFIYLDSNFITNKLVK